MSTLRILNCKGDTVVTWAPEKAATGDAGAISAVAEAERILAEAQAQGATAFRVLPDGEAERLETFDPATEQDIVIVPRIAGG